MNKPSQFFFSRGATRAAFALALLGLVSSGLGQAPKATAPPPTIPPVRIAMSAAFVSESGMPVFQKINDYLSAKSGIPCEFITGLSYETINKMLAVGAVDAAYVCGLPYVIERDKAQPSVALLVAPVMKDARYHDQPKYFSDLVVKKESPFQSLADLRGKTYVYNDELSNSGYNMPRFKLVEIGETKGFFGKVLRSGSHEESIRMVAEGKADASFVDSLVLDFDRTKGTGDADKVRVIESRGPAGICPVVVSVKMPEPRRQKLQAAFLGMNQDPEGRKLLDEALVARFEKVDDHNYDDIRLMKKAAEDAGFNSIK
jgi:phosphonate transport system substrate-binding protein